MDYIIYLIYVIYHILLVLGSELDSGLGMGVWGHAESKNKHIHFENVFIIQSKRSNDSVGF